ncbi:MAG: acyltransferase [Bacteroidales bacterium]|nr:acyltransferase [Bacteroidales bacterium]
MANTRNSNLELLRIVAMAFIVVWHISIHAQKGEAITHDFIASIAITGVNLFVLISGYFGIKLKWKSLLNILSCAIFYYSITLLCNYIFFDPTLNLVKEIECIFTPISNYKTYWFVSTYIMLMLLSPAINTILNKMNKQQYIFFIGVMFYICCITGFVFQHSININGYNLFNFIFIYSVGHLLRKYDIPHKFCARFLVLIYISATIIIFIGSYLNIGRTLNYNNPIIVISAIAFFCLFARQNFNNCHINTIAKNMFPVYLVQESSLGVEIYRLLYTFGKETNFQGAGYFIILALYITILFISAFIFEKIRLLILKKPLEHLSKYLTDKYTFLEEL